MFGKDWWEVEIHIRISGRGKIGADGMAVWYTVEGSPPENNADYTVYGSRNNWMGLGIILDSFDNNAQQDNPIIMAFVNDGTKHYKHEQVLIVFHQSSFLVFHFRMVAKKSFSIAEKIFETSLIQSG